MSQQFLEMPDDKGYFGEYGGQIIPPELVEIMNEINDAYEKVRNTQAFKEELYDLQSITLVARVQFTMQSV